MNKNAQRVRTQERRGFVTVEMIAFTTAILVPFLLALAELGRLDRAASSLLYAAQQSCIAAAADGNTNPFFRLVSVESRVEVAVRPEVSALLGGGASGSVTLRRCYWIATGTGRGAIGD